MNFSSQLQQATLLKRYKRFLVDLRTADGEEFTVHCANTGRMTNCADSGFTAYYSTSDNPKRKYMHSLELTQDQVGHFICVNTAVANKVAVEAIERGIITQLNGYDTLQTEIKYGAENSRIDILLSSNENGQPPHLCYVEVKSVTLLEQQQGFFPDAETARGQKHLRELIQIKQQGHRAVLLFAALHTGIKNVRPAAHIDQKYAALIKEAISHGVEIIAYRAHVDDRQVQLIEEIPFDCA
ncbi:DNA/RNA nuclease SfsA [Pseudoalteromonas peptidolytica]|uniref:Sugar fermentation stimulation protein homolog n=1 Tax=Pseudoalteromonas peptidolytica F12-50-A1 TaxID=1315280 RepID=A0A8I0MT35_9GAMM|nr:DNA/RNA nuclease SfsA [Pseudoalteromonas peptidolytica]MBE0345216.1 sugar fermentation stimulation protein A [Pseudoalteromonas peptidolytica F12-50-A1]NLR16504.1 DNA/RNA nuclease SfsA [Pseudoalteromonas peptidolytica]GEK09850.1 sugar fermentation stimulation protein [Pseudoalteromonas peptidolytica]